MEYILTDYFDFGCGSLNCTFTSPCKGAGICDITSNTRYGYFSSSLGSCFSSECRPVVAPAYYTSIILLYPCVYMSCIFVDNICILN